MKDVKLVTVEVAEIKPSQKERHYTNADADTDTDTDANAEADKRVTEASTVTATAAEEASLLFSEESLTDLVWEFLMSIHSFFPL